jgi:hypothetical protein
MKIYQYKDSTSKTGLEFAVTEDGLVFERERYLDPRYGVKSTEWAASPEKRQKLLRTLPSYIRKGRNVVTYIYRRMNNRLRLPI